MSVFQGRDLKKKTGGRRHKLRDKRKSELGSLPANPTIGKTDKKTARMLGGGLKTVLKQAEYATVFDPEAKAWKRAALRTEKENPANRNFARMNILTRGALVDTDIGPIRITNRPGQEGTVSGVLVKEAKTQETKTQ